MEYGKEPKHTDSAVYEVVNFLDTRKHSATEVSDFRRRPAREVHETPDLSYSGGDVRSTHKHKQSAWKRPGGYTAKTDLIHPTPI